mgnify:CR=1 FL=1
MNSKIINVKDGGFHVVSGENPFNSERVSQEPICVNSCIMTTMKNGSLFCVPKVGWITS